MLAMTYSQLVKHFGSGSAAARALGFSKQRVNNWRRDGIPLGIQARIQILTGGALRAK